MADAIAERAWTEEERSVVWNRIVKRWLHRQWMEPERILRIAEMLDQITDNKNPAQGGAK